MKTSTRAMPLFLEFVGTATLSLVVFSIIRWTGMPLYRALGVGLTYGLILAVARPYYVPQLNPIVSFGLFMTRRLSFLRTIATVGVQMLGGVAAWQLSEFILDKPLTNLAGDKFNWQIFAAEALGAFVFTFLLSFVLYKQKVDDVKLVFVGIVSITLGMTVAALAQGGYGIINPALAAGIQSWSWTYILGALTGGFIGMNVIPFMNVVDASKTSSSKKATTKRTTKKKTTKKK